MSTKKIRTLQAQIARIKKKIAAIDEMRPGSLSRQYNVCGNPRCRCKDPVNPRKHGPYYQLSYTHNGKSTTEFVSKDMVETVRKQLTDYKTFKRLMGEWIDATMEIDRLRREERKAKS